MIRELGIYAGQAGIFREAAESRSLFGGDGLALSLLHTGTAYDDDLSEDGLLYHYPSTNRVGRHDDAEIASVKAAFNLGVPVFVIIGEKGAKKRTLKLAYIQDFDDYSALFLVGFASDLVAEGPRAESGAFDLFETSETPRLAMIRRRPNQQRFKFDVLRRYGPACAVCGIQIPNLITAAHIVPKKAKGSDDPRNGLPLCANHHIAFDAGLWKIAPGSHRLIAAETTSLRDLQIPRLDLRHLAHLPHGESRFGHGSAASKVSDQRRRQLSPALACLRALALSLLRSLLALVFYFLESLFSVAFVAQLVFPRCLLSALPGSSRPDQNGGHTRNASGARRSTNPRTR